MAEINIKISKSIFNECYMPYLDNEDRYLLFFGGASSGKSYFVAQRYIYKLLKNKMNLLVVRKTGDTNRQSTFPLLKQIIRKWNLSDKFKINESDMRIRCLLNGNEIVFKGLDDVEKIKSTTFEGGELTDIWIEEASEVEENDIKQLRIRLRGGKQKKQIVMSFNPIDINHFLKREYVDTGKAIFVRTTHKDNKFLTDDDRAELESFKETDPYYYTVYCLGEWGVYGASIFDKLRVAERIGELREKDPVIKKGYFDYKITNEDISDIKWIDDPEGYIEIYKDVKKGNPYIIGGDTAGEGSDFFTGQVLDNITGQQVAMLKQQFDEDLYANQIYCLGKYYNNALIGIEMNYTMMPIKKLQDYKYSKIYIRGQSEDSVSHKVIMKYGFHTNKTSRPVIIAELVKIVREQVYLINDLETLYEMQTFIRNEKGRPEAQDGKHDDLIMALAIAFYIRPQQSFETSVEGVNRDRWTEDMWEDYNSADNEGKRYLDKKWGK